MKDKIVHNHQTLFSIGEFAKICGVHIKALRYYDSLGILPPAYVNPESGYRYYSFRQREVVDAIQLCVAFDIPLSEYKNFSKEEISSIDYRNLIEKASDKIKEKIEELQRQLDFCERAKYSMNRSENLYAGKKPQRCTLPARTIYAAPYSGSNTDEEYQYIASKLLMDIHTKFGLHRGNSNGIILLHEKDSWKRYLFVDVRVPEKDIASYPNFVHIPSGEYLCHASIDSNIERVWDWVPELISEEQIDCIIETELFTEDYLYQHPFFELRCKLKNT